MGHPPSLRTSKFDLRTSMDPKLGAFEEFVLLAVAGLADEAYAVPIQQRIEQLAGRSATMGAVYTALDRLEQKGYAASWLGDVTPEPGGRRKRFYRLTASGAEALRAVRDARERLREGLDLRPSVYLP